jgi:hypothetical protein
MIIIQSGHKNIKNNCNVALRSGTGAGGEVEITTAVADAVAPLLKAKGVEVLLVDANFNCNSTSADKDYQLFLSLHCDMDYANDQGSGFCDYPEPSTDGATLESQRLAKEIQNSFFPAVGINIKSRSNANTRFYYMWSALSSKTPCVLIEMGQVKDPHDSPILLNTQKVAIALANAILSALKVSVVPDELAVLKAKVMELSTQIKELLSALDACSANKTTVTNLLEAEVTQRKLLQATVSEQAKLIATLQAELQKAKPISSYSFKELLGELIKKAGGN